MPKDILILGGGTGGVVAALTLSEAREKYGLDINITVVNRDEWHYMPPLWMDVALEGMPIDETRAPIRGLEKYGVNVVVSEATSIDLANRAVGLANGNVLTYDYLFITLGLRNAWEKIPGYKEAGYHNYSPEGALELHEAFKRFRGGKIVIATPEVPFRCGIYPIEFATVLGHYFRTRGVNAEIVVLSPKMPNGAGLVEALGPDIARLWRKYLDKYGIEVKLHDGIERVDPQRRTVVTKNFEETYDLLIKVPPPAPPKILEGPEWLWDMDPRFVAARPRDFRHPKYDDVFLTGEHSMPPTGLGTAGVFVHAATHKATQILLTEEYGVGTVQEIPPVVCVAFVADRGFMGVCEVEFDGQMYRWNHACYNVMESYAMRMVKLAFYKGWLDRLRF